MAKLSLINRDEKRRQMVAKYAKKYAELKAAANDAAAYRAAPRVKKMKYVSLRPSWSDDEAQTMRPKMLKSEMRPTKPAPTAAATTVSSPSS